MEGASHISPSQPPCFLAPKTASGGSRRRRPHRARRSASQALGAHRKNCPNGRGRSSEYRIFGDNVAALLPDAIGQVVGRALGTAADNAIAKAQQTSQQATAAPNTTSSQTTGDPAEIVVTARPTRTGYVDYFPTVTAALIDFDLQSGGLEYAAARHRDRVIEDLAGRYKTSILPGSEGPNTGPQGPLTADGLAPQPTGGPDIAISMGELNSWRARALDIYQNGYVENGVNKAYSASFYNELVKGYDLNEALIHQWNAIADAEVNKLLFAGVGAPALLAGGAIAVPAVAGYAGSFYVGGTASTIASGGAGFVTGGTFGAGFEFTKNRAFGLPDTAGGYTTAILGGGIGGTGLRLLPNTVLGQAVSARAQTVALGGFSGLVGDGAGQLVTSGGDRSQINYGQLVLATGLGGGLGAVTPLEVRLNGFSSGRNSSLSVYQGLNTRLNSGNITQMQLRYPVNAGAANAVVGSGQQAVGTIVDGVKQRVGR